MMKCRYCICLLISFSNKKLNLSTQKYCLLYIYIYYVDLLSIKANINTHTCLDSVKRQDRHLGKFDKTKLCSWASLWICLGRCGVKNVAIVAVGYGDRAASFSEVCLPKISTIICFMILTVSLASPKSFEQ